MVLKANASRALALGADWDSQKGLKDYRLSSLLNTDQKVRNLFKSACCIAAMPLRRRDEVFRFEKPGGFADPSGL
jgi:hypothetical protein